MKKDFIEFIKPDVWKIIIFTILLILTFFIPKTTEVCGPAPAGVGCGEIPTIGIGHPPFYILECLGDVCGFMRFYPANFIINILVYYLISCFIILIFKNFRNKK